ncbi:CMP-N-acetylneuraminate-beta-galactosamide-alpha-2,3-sialyltransferase 1-like [Neosynchiropus ocellatus]
MPSRMKKSRAVLLLLSSLTTLGLVLPLLRAGRNTQCACPRCLTEGTDEFSEVLRTAPEPFLLKSSKTTEEDFNWWKRVQREKKPFSVFTTKIEELFQIFPPSPDLVGPSPDRCRTCAVVGNSGNLKGSHYGHLIDSHDIVIRMNRGITTGYEVDVGSKTTHHVMYPESAKTLVNTTHLVFIPFKMKDLQWLQRNFVPGAKWRANKDLVMILNPAFMRYVHETLLQKRGRYPSTGFLAVAFSMQMCDQVSVFGFGADSNGNWYHYFELLRNRRLKTGPHAGTHEYNVILQLHDEDKLQFFQGF